MNTLKNKIDLLRTKLLIFALVLGNSCLFSMASYADVVSDLKNTMLYKGTVALIGGVINVLLALVVLITTVLAIIKGIQWQLADDQEKPAKKKALTHVIMIGIIIASIVGLVSVIFKAYGLSDETGSNVAGLLVRYI